MLFKIFEVKKLKKAIGEKDFEINLLQSDIYNFKKALCRSERRLERKINKNEELEHEIENLKYKIKILENTVLNASRKLNDTINQNITPKVLAKSLEHGLVELCNYIDETIKNESIKRM